LNFKNIHYVLTVAEEKSFSQAAKKLFVSQPWLSQLINNIEDEIGTKIFDRSTIPLTLTYAGERYIDAISEILDIEKKLKRELEDITENRSGKLTIGISSLMGSFILPSVFPLFKQEFPNIILKLIEGKQDELEALTLKGGVDLALIYQTVPNSELNCINVHDSKIMLAAPINHKISKSIDLKTNVGLVIDLNNIKDEPFVLLTQNMGLRKITDKIFRAYDITPNIIFETESIEIAHKFVSEGIAFTMVVENFTKFLPNKNKVDYFYFSKNPDPYFYTICHRKNMYLSKPILRFMELVQQSISICFNKSEEII